MKKKMVCFHTKKIIHRKFKVKHASFKGLSLLPPLLIARQDVEKGSRLPGTILTAGTSPQIAAFKFQICEINGVKGK